MGVKASTEGEAGAAAGGGAGVAWRGRLVGSWRSGTPSMGVNTKLPGVAPAKLPCERVNEGVLLLVGLAAGFGGMGLGEGSGVGCLAAGDGGMGLGGAGRLS